MERGLSLITLPVAGTLPSKRGWFRVEAEPKGSISGHQLYLDLGVGFNRHHSVSLPRNTGAHYLRVTSPVRSVALATDTPGFVANVRFKPISLFRAIGEWIADGFAVALIGLRHPLQESSSRPIVRWSLRGLQVIPAGECRFPARSRYDLWRKRYSRSREAPKTPAGLVEVRGADVSADILNNLLDRDGLAWIGLVRTDADFHPRAFAFLQQAAVAAKARVAYADSDHLDRRGRPCKPTFRTAFSPEHLLSDDWLGPLLLIDAAAAKRIGGWRAEAGEGLHYDLCLRMLEEVGPSGFVHFPAILASERASKELRSNELDRIRGAAIDRRRLPRQAFGLPAAAAPASVALKTSVIIPTRDRLDLLRPAIDSIYRKSTTVPGEVLIVDNGSQAQETLDWFRTANSLYAGLKIIRNDRPFNFSSLCNEAARMAQGSILAFLNNDIEIGSPMWLELCGTMALQAGIGCVGPLLTYSDGRIQHAGLITGPGGIATHVWSGHRVHQASKQVAPLVTRNVSGLTGACLILTKTAFESVNGFDEQHLSIAFSDLDLCLRLSELGLRHVLVPWCKVIHHESRSRDPDTYAAPDGRFRAEYNWMRSRWGEVIDNDPFFSRSLRIDKSRPTLFWIGD